MSNLHIAKGLSLPIELMTLTTAILGIRNSGKTNTAGVFVEELLSQGQQTVVIDPLDVWYGMKSSADGKSPGFPVVVLGGEHGDLPVRDIDGKVIADFVVRERIPCILSLRHMSKAGQRRFVADFAEHLYERKGDVRNRTPVQVVIDEASSFIPQRVMGDTARMVGAIEDLVRRGRASGIGVVLIDQRAASINKDVLTQIELLIAHRTTSPQDRKALELWVEAHDTEGRQKEFLASLASLDQGEAWLWSPGWLNLFEKVKIRKRKTFDSSATPKVGEKVVAPTKLADVDLEKLRSQLAETIEQAKADDPKELKKQIVQLKAENLQLSKELPRAVAEMATKIERVEIKVPYLSEETLARLEQLMSQAVTLAGELSQAERDLRAEVVYSRETQQRFLSAKPAPAPSKQVIKPVIKSPVKESLPPAGKSVSTRKAGDIQISATQQRILDALAWYESIGINDPTNLQIGAIALIDATGGHFSNTVGPLSSNGLVQRGGGTMRLTDEGRAYARVPEEVASLADFHNVLRARVRKARSASQRTVDMLDVILSRQGFAVSTEVIGKEVGIDHTGGHFSNTIGPLSTLGLIRRSQGMVYPTAILFPPGIS